MKLSPIAYTTALLTNDLGLGVFPNVDGGLKITSTLPVDHIASTCPCEDKTT